ncbi:hypothetical protein Zmor_019726 [Zophobas morio]|uniref:Uncharacterized protein n=1 Tax=Zophobas morio TaxID=2755281 RepID=A0AA38M9C9_9CUCU|nr:hypothetical protein Zmor_019726 [Zophobas morio]
MQSLALRNHTWGNFKRHPPPPSPKTQPLNSISGSKTQVPSPFRLISNQLPRRISADYSRLPLKPRSLIRKVRQRLRFPDKIPKSTLLPDFRTVTCTLTRNQSPDPRYRSRYDARESTAPPPLDKLRIIKNLI